MTDRPESPNTTDSAEAALDAGLAAAFAPNGTGDYKSRSMPNETPGTVIAGKYKLLERIGEGGMGSVWMAQQTEPVKRHVAVKLIKTGMDSKQVIARFEAERQALAVMDHPNIAKILDGGVSEKGAPYFVMELVKGVPITKYCDEHKLTPRQRLELFVPVCQAIQHAHQKGIIHRDIKPSNVMVAPYDDTPVPKVIDFGVAKATGQSLTDQTLNTGFGGIAGTPQYMSPEQATLNNLDIDTRSDIYSLGVLLYELLTGGPPFAQKDLEKAGMLEMLRVIREEEPPRPSTKLSTADALPSLSASRGTEPKKLTGILRNELDWIVMKALEKDRTRRYETANGFAADINRYLAGEPVNAHPPSAGYRMKKFLRKHKGPAIAASLIALALIGGIIGTGWGLARADQARARETQRAEGERLAKEAAQRREAETKAVLDFVENKVFAAARPKDQEGGQGYEVKLADAIAAALPSLEKSFTDQPLIEARLRMTLGKSFSYLGKHERAEQQYHRARDLYTAKLGPDHSDTLASMMGLAVTYSDLGRHPEALTLREETLKLVMAKLGPDHPDTLSNMNNLAISYTDLGRYLEALALREETLKLRKAKLGPDHPLTLTCMSNLAISYEVLGRHREALTLGEETLKLRKAKLGPNHPDTLASMNNLANSYETLGRHQEALTLREETLKLKKAKLGPDHPDTLLTMTNLANSYAGLGRLPEALTLREETLKLKKAKLGPDHPDTLNSMNNLAYSYRDVGRHPEELALFEETLKLRKAKQGANHPATLGSMHNLAISYAALGRLPEAQALFEETLKRQKATLGPDHLDTLTSMNNLAHCYTALGRLPEAQALREDTLELQKVRLGANHPNTVGTIYDIACTHALMISKAEDRGKQADLAMDWLKQVVAAGYKNVAHIKKDTDLDPLREREDFKKLIAEMEKKNTSNEKQ
jgi:eukaryotic-like serine/threonine-protein kinase